MSASGAGGIQIRDWCCLAVLPGGAALDEVERREEQELEEAGWERVEVEGRIAWRRPDTGHLYPRGSAYDVRRRRDQR
jgi:hypothetical protein